jgi:hypothetical protein
MIGVTTVARRMARLEYAVVRQPFALFEDRVVARCWEENATVRVGFERFLGSLDWVAGRLLADDAISARGRALLRQDGFPAAVGVPAPTPRARGGRQAQEAEAWAAWERAQPWYAPEQEKARQATGRAGALHPPEQERAWQAPGQEGARQAPGQEGTRQAAGRAGALHPPERAGTRQAPEQAEEATHGRAAAHQEPEDEQHGHGEAGAPAGHGEAGAPAAPDEPPAQDAAGERAAGQPGTPAEQAAGAGTVDVTFTLPAEVSADTVALCGDFNDWSVQSVMLERGSDGSWGATVALEPGRSYRYRYLLDGRCWENDWHADRYMPNSHGGTDSVVVVQ